MAAVHPIPPIFKSKLDGGFGEGFRMPAHRGYPRAL